MMEPGSKAEGDTVLAAQLVALAAALSALIYAVEHPVKVMFWVFLFVEFMVNVLLPGVSRVLLIVKEFISKYFWAIFGVAFFITAVAAAAHGFDEDYEEPSDGLQGVVFDFWTHPLTSQTKLAASLIFGLAFAVFLALETKSFDGLFVAGARGIVAILLFVIGGSLVEGVAKFFIDTLASVMAASSFIKVIREGFGGKAARELSLIKGIADLVALFSLPLGLYVVSQRDYSKPCCFVEGGPWVPQGQDPWPL